MLSHWIWFAMLPELNARTKLMLLARFSDPEDIYNANEAILSEVEGMTPKILEVLQDKSLAEAEKICRVCRKKDIRILPISDPAYPSRLRNISDPPLVLYARGVLPDFDSMPVISVVGTRKATGYGLNIARKISGQIASCGALVVSGGAAGIDTMAMQGALDADKPVVGVLGCGVDVVYPRTNGPLFVKTLEKGCLLSEYAPGTKPLPWQFPQRNRILSGLSNGVLVVEAPQRSGALITARQALEQGRDVFVIPGNIDVEACGGSNALLQEGAGAVFNGWDVVREYEALYPGKVEKKDLLTPMQTVSVAGSLRQEESLAKVAQKPAFGKNDGEESVKKGIDNTPSSNYSGINDQLSGLTQEEREIVRHLCRQPRAVDDVIAELGLPANKVLSQLTMLAVKGIVINHPGKRVSLRSEISK